MKAYHVIELAWDREAAESERSACWVDGERISASEAPQRMRRLVETWLDASKGPPDASEVVYRCSFCGQVPSEERLVVEGPGGQHACAECIELMHSKLLHQK